jgi:hypothetical protein
MGRKILHIADLHLGYAPRALGDAAAAHQKQRDSLLTRIADWVLGEVRDEIGMLLIAGDLFETPHPDPGLAEAVIGDLARVADAGVHVVTLPGNHDELTYPDSVYRAQADRWPGLLITRPRPHLAGEFQLGETAVAVHSMAYIQSESPESPVFPAAPDDGRFHIAALHATLTDRLGGYIAEGERALKIRCDDLSQKGYAYIALGHIHRGTLEWTGAGTAAAYGGCIEGRSFHDPGGAGLLLVDPASRPPGLERRPFARHSIRDAVIPLHEAQDEAALERRILDAAGARATSQNPAPGDSSDARDPGMIALRVRLTGHAEFSFELERLQARLAPRFLALEIAVDDPSWDLGDWTRWKNEETLRGAVVRTALERMAAGTEADREFLAEAAALALRALHEASQEGAAAR